jgi:hypothetical protein
MAAICTGSHSAVSALCLPDDVLPDISFCRDGLFTIPGPSCPLNFAGQKNPYWLINCSWGCRVPFGGFGFITFNGNAWYRRARLESELFPTPGNLDALMWNGVLTDPAGLLNAPTTFNFSGSMSVSLP